MKGYRSEIAALKRRIEALEKQISRLEKMAPKMGALVGVAAQTIYNWEAGTSRPRAEQFAVIAAVRKMGKREVKARLDQIQSD